MRSLLFIPVFVFCTLITKANPIPPPPPFSEIIINQNGFIIELDLWMWGIENLDNIRLVSSYGQASFNQGIPVIADELVIVTEADLQGPLYINPEGDVLIIEENSGSGWWEMDKICFGNHPDSWVSAPIGGESIVRQAFGSSFDHFYWIVKNKPPTPDSLPHWTDSRGTLSGYVLDKYSIGIPWPWIKYCEEPLLGVNPYLSTIYADSSGYFFCDNMFAREYDIEIIMYDKVYWNDHIIIEPDSNNYYEFVIDSIAVGLPETSLPPAIDICNYPNPFTNNTTFDLNIPHNYYWNEAQITIVDINGKIVDRIEYHNSGDKAEQKINWHAPSDLDPGIYIYALEIDNKRIASNRMILINE